MIDVIVGPKGSGKTAKLVSEITAKADLPESNIVCIEYGKRFDKQIPYQVRLIDAAEYPINSYDQLLSFIAGIAAKDFDITQIYIDSVYKIARDDNPGHLDKFCNDLADFAKNIGAQVTVTISDELEALPDNIKTYLRKS